MIRATSSDFCLSVLLLGTFAARSSGLRTPDLRGSLSSSKCPPNHESQLYGNLRSPRLVFQDVLPRLRDLVMRCPQEAQNKLIAGADIDCLLSVK